MPSARRSSPPPLRTADFKEDIIQIFYDGIRHKQDTIFGNVKTDVISDKEANFRKGNYCSVIWASCWPGNARALNCRCRHHD
jgi:hypothetical protein